MSYAASGVIQAGKVVAEAVPLVSVGVPVYNAGSYLELALTSLLSQDYPNVELCISDNASTDGSTELCRKFAARHPNIRLNVNSQNFGMVENFERVRKMATGDFFFWAGADDLWRPDFLSKLVQELDRHPGSALAMSATAMIDRNGRSVGAVTYDGELNPNTMSPLRQFGALMTTSTSVKLAKLNLFFCGLWRLPELNIIVNADPGIHFGGDRPMPAIGALIGGLRYVPEPLHIKRIHGETFLDRNSADPYVLIRRQHGLSRVVADMVRWIMICPRVPFGRKVAASLYMLRFPLMRLIAQAISLTPGPMRRVGGRILRKLSLVNTKAGR